MRATTRCTPKVSRASRAEMMLELSPLDTAANASARSVPASTSTAWSKPTPVTVRPAKSGPRRRNASGFWSMIATLCPRDSRLAATVEPTPPQPIITMCTLLLPPCAACPVDRDATRSTPAVVDHGPPSARVLDSGPYASMVALPTAILKRLLLGRPFRSDRLQHTLLPKRIALPVFASDALSSVAYAPDEILLTLSIAGASAFVFSPWVALAVVVVMLTVVAGSRQNVHAYPSGGGDYEVASVNLGPRYGLGVGSALLVDYVLTVAVSVSSGVANLGSVLPVVPQHTVALAVAAVGLLTAVNLRGIRESGTWFAIPTYGFMIVVVGMVLTG